ncbi:hypothetical protein [Clostridium perfringens]|uniref:hypothetical protein n=1 Tax=Clostridium perfringens TaxID=1502 RepID=UPI0018E4775F|nr:hypothetical protein [Clostridium perfringens]MBI5996978.1 hypothetical protein [Clostridium perfringens]
MRKIKVNGIIFLISLISYLFIGGNTAFAKENPNTIEFLSYDEEILILRSTGETVLISEGDNVEGILEGINKENLKEIDLLVLRSMEEETDELLKKFINKSSVKKILLPTLKGVSEDVINILKGKNIEIASMEEGFNYNKESISLNAKKLEGAKEGMIFATVDNIKLAVLSEEAYDSAINLSNIEDCRVEILNLIDSEKESKKEVKKLVKRLKPLVIIEDLDNGESIEKLGVKHYNLNEEKGLKIMRVLGETKEFKVLSKKEGYTK